MSWYVAGRATEGKRNLSKLQKYLLYPLFLPAVKMPGKSYRGPVVPLTETQRILRERLEKRVNDLATDIGERSIENYAGMLKAIKYVTTAFVQCDYTVEEQPIVFHQKEMPNLAVEKKGSDRAHEIVVIGAHYDTVPGSPGADDNATGVAAVLELARIFRNEHFSRTVRLIAFANEEHPGGLMTSMGSYEYARSCHERNESVVAMLSLEMLGYFSSEPDSQRYPSPFNLFYPPVADFIAFVGDARSRSLVARTVKTFRKVIQFPCEGAAPPDVLVPDVSRSDHWGFSQFGYPALMVTDTSNFRYSHYHEKSDTPDKLDFVRFTQVVDGLVHVVRDLANS